MSSKQANEKSQVTKKMVRITIEVKKRNCRKNMKVHCVSGTWLTTVSTIVKNKDIIK